MHLPPKSFYLVRHGESFANRFHYPSGRMDTHLTQKGVKQARALAEDIAGLDPAPGIMITSPLRRAAETADILNARLRLTLIRDRWIMEQHYGVFQGRGKAGLRAAHGHNWFFEPEGGETVARFDRRIISRLSYWLEKCEAVPVFVCHGGVFMAVGRQLGLDLRGTSNCAVCYVSRPGRRADWQIRMQGNNEEVDSL